MAKKSGVAEKVDVREELQPNTDAARGGMVNSVVHNPEFTGIARSVECYNNQGHSNFRILTLHIEKGKVLKMDVSDPYAQWEAISRLELWTQLATTHLNTKWENGKSWSK